LEERLRHAAAHGVPNYFGAQRFGRDGGNVAHAEAMFLGRERVKDRHRRSLYLSAARAQLFNAVLTSRVARGDWNKAAAGDVMMLDGSRSVFRLDTLNDVEQKRVACMDIHPTGPLWGQGELSSGEQVRILERQVGATFPVLSRGLEQAGLAQERRALRLRLRSQTVERAVNGDLTVGFQLPKGTFATTVLRELVAIADS
jgi:tRNA pseudouridine13 synthase